MHGKSTCHLSEAFIARIMRHLRKSELAVYIALRSHYPNAWPTQHRIGELSGRRQAAVNEALNGLQAVGLITRQRQSRSRGDPADSTRYTFADIDDAAAVAEIERKLLARSGRTPEIRSVRKSGDTYSGDPELGTPEIRRLRHRSKTTKKDNQGSDDGFDQFWEKYPGQRRYGRDKCLRLWRSMGLAQKRDEVMAGLKQWAQSEQWERGMVPNPLRWLEEERWDAEVPRNESELATDRVVPSREEFLAVMNE